MMATIRRYISDRTDGDGRAEIYLRFSGGRGKVYRLRTGLRINPARWNTETGAVIIPRLGTAEQRELVQLRSRLDELCNLLIERYSDQHANVDKEWLVRQIRLYHHPEQEGYVELDLIDTFDGFLAEEEGQRKKNMNGLRTEIVRYGMFAGGLPSLDAWDGGSLRSFEDFLDKEHLYCSQSRYRYIYGADVSTPVQRHSRNSIVCRMKQLRSFFGWCRKRHLISDSPFSDYQIEAEVYGTPYYLTIEERDRIAHVNLSRHPRLAEQRDIFVFQCLVGCRVSDLLRMRKSSVIDRAVEYIAKKTAGERPSVIRVPLTESAQEIVDRYADTDDDRLLPFISAQKYNDAIKRVFLAARLTRPVTVLDPQTRQEVRKPLNEIASSHLARRTFIGNLYRQVKDPALVGALSGHAEGSRAFARYRTIDEQMKEELVRLLEKKP